jgi:hypothetical protein
MNKRLIWISLGAFLLLMQLIQPNQKNPAVDPAVDFAHRMAPPEQVVSLLKEACYDCHSNETRYPWYARISPVSWWIANHVEEGREHLNFSEFGLLAPDRVAEQYGEIAETIEEGEMPLPSYTWFGMHPQAKLTAAERQTLAQWMAAHFSEGERGGQVITDEELEGDED